MSGHTPTPWRVGRKNDYTGKLVVETDEDYIADCDMETGRDEANARYIVLAVNAHADLVEALKRCLPAIRMYANLDDCEAAEAALAKAEPALREEEK